LHILYLSIYLSIPSYTVAVPDSNKLRNHLFGQCSSLNEKHPNINSTTEFFKICEHGKFAKGSARDTVRADDIVAAYEHSVYCMCPPGDTPVRRAVFDALLAGCIPVLFRTRQTPNPIDQYNWHLSSEEASDIFVFFDAIDANTTYQNHLSMLVESFSENEVHTRQRAITAVSRKLQYSMPPDVQHYGVPPVEKKMPTWDPPFRDAVDVILDNLFEKVENQIMT
jgi:hypothetical protein